ncbi:MAG TPA: cation-translocating P-type ATPase [Anaerolineales bacterium]|nr:cation-translocating P-type ATPase [Anaerolineales bacterium]HMV97877.1 cation-translocating P-type ATPase [Anaerolineales bacterium]HMX19641.1 cation-translocating P-type ATPase [Anaerolineales bacterium]HMX75078.1 cation-translocating P-type ATPase [Anaerolineales bacterium]HMZ44104.1 cation-translocating P-type ATPase [Anaerolineales bacterium]
MAIEKKEDMLQENAWHALNAEQVLRDLEVHEEGLTSAEAEKRLAHYGPNQLREAPRPGFLALLWGQLNNFVVILLIVASVISALLGDYIEAAAIMAIVVLNAVLGIVQEQRAEQALAALKKLAAPDARVLRDGAHTSVPSYNLVPGDIVFLEAGNFIPADLRLLEAVNLRVEEASLTGESLPVQKNAATVLDKNVPLGDRKNTAFMGTVVNYGRGRGVVTSTGMRTQLGLIATMLQNVETEETPLQRRLDQLGRSLSIGSLILVAVVFIVALFNYTEISGLFSSPLDYLKEFASEITEVFIIAISLAIAAVPEGLPAVVTISLALGMREMVQRHALIRKLSSVETLGSATTICSDKTGTLTQNEMTVTRVWADNQFVHITGTGYAPNGEFQMDGKTVDVTKYPAILSALWLGILNNDATIETTGETESQRTYRIVGDPTEGALLVAAAKAGAIHVDIDEAYPRENEVPFDSERKRMITIHDVRSPKPTDPSPFYDEKHKDWDVIAVKGAPDIVLELCTKYLGMDDKPREMTKEAKERVLAANDAMTKDALRVLGFAYRVEKDVPDNPENIKADELEKDLVFVGLLGMIDPPRTEVKPALEKARHAGIRTVMITGDFPNTAKAIAESISLLRPGKNVMTGAQLDAIDDNELKRIIEDTDVFARVSPEHKMRIVDALQANDEIVAMTGDGVNDAPAIKRADIGVSMGITGTDVAKETADMVLTDDNYASIVSAVEQGRIIYSNIRKFVFFLLSSNVAEIMIIFLATLAGLPAPLTAIQLLWLNLITDGAPALALAMEKGDPDIMDQKPRAKNEPIVNRSMGIGIIVQTIAQTSAVLGAFVMGLAWHLEAGAVLPSGMNVLSFVLSHDWRGVDVQTAETMAFVTLSLAELFRAYTVRSERASIFQIGFFSNKYMQYAVGISIALLLLVCAVPFLQPIFNTHFLSGREWGLVLGLALMPAVAEEITKFFLRRSRA